VKILFFKDAGRGLVAAQYGLEISTTGNKNIF
jgi:hypothetical protein